MKKISKLLVALCVIVIASLTIVGVNLKNGTGQKSTTKEAQNTTQIPETTVEATVEATVDASTEEVKPDAEVSLISLGDNLIHDSLLSMGQQSDGSYNFDFEFQNIKKDIADADVAVINQETVMGGAIAPYAGYPSFNSPFAVADAEHKAGFDVILQATNHTLDIGEQAVFNDMDYFKKTYPKMKVLGINASKKAQKKIPIIEKNGIRIAMLNYTYGLNAGSLTAEHAYLINLLDEDQVKKDIKAAKKQADFVIVFPHWGIEYQMKSNEDQQKMAQLMADAGADLIIGTHPHVLEEVKELTGASGNQTVCYYSLGNYISGQDTAAAMLGGMAKIVIERKNGVTSLKSAKLVPLLTYYSYGYGETYTYKLSEFPKNLESSHGVKAYDSSFSLKEMNRLLKETIDAKWIENE